MFKEAVSPLQMGWTWLNGSNMLFYLQKRSRRGWRHCLFLFSDPLAIASESDCPSPLCGFSRSLHPLLILPCCHKTQAFAAFLLNSSIGQPMDDRPQLGRLSTRNRLKRGSKPLGPSWRDPVEILDVDDIQWFTYIGSYVEVIWNDIHVYIYYICLKSSNTIRLNICVLITCHEQWRHHDKAMPISIGNMYEHIYVHDAWCFIW